MRFRGLVLFPFLYAAVVLAIASQLGDPVPNLFVLGNRIVLRILTLVGCLAAASVFDRGDHLRSAWTWLAASRLLILVRDVLRLFPAFDPATASPEAKAFLSGLAVLFNLALLVGIVKLARSWKMAAIAMPGGRSGTAAVVAVTAVLAIALAGPSALRSAQNLAQGDWNALALLVSAVTDIIILCLTAPLLLTAVALRGGLFFWPWALITASQVSWLLYDAAALAPMTVGGLPLSELFRGIAENFLCVSGLAQFFVVRQVRRSTARLPG